ncbi:excinuclease ABC subunit B [Synergistales bacterium]|nr:excinuclease ABC subunit B [Synergistales bacterium]
MICSHCGKREADVVIRQIINDEAHNVNLCRECAEELGFIREVPTITISFSLARIDVEEPQKANKKAKQERAEKKENQYDSLVCGSCGENYEEFRSSGLLGCPGCYEAFRLPLGAHLQKEQGAESHWSTSEAFGNIGVLDDMAPPVLLPSNLPEFLPESDGVKKLRNELDDAISREDYEAAARLRDMIASMLEDDFDDA